MTLAIKIESRWHELLSGVDVVSADGIQASFETVTMWSDDERAAFGVYPVSEPNRPPPGKVETGRELTGDDLPVWRVTYADAPPPSMATLSDWRSGLYLWMRDNDKGGKVSRLDDVYAAIKPLEAAGNPVGKVAMQQLEYSNTVGLDRLLRLRQAFGFSEADCIESMWRAGQAAVGDIRGLWPLPAGEVPGTPPAT